MLSPAATGHASPNWQPPPRRSDTGADSHLTTNSAASLDCAGRLTDEVCAYGAGALPSPRVHHQCDEVDDGHDGESGIDERRRSSPGLDMWIGHHADRSGGDEECDCRHADTRGCEENEHQ